MNRRQKIWMAVLLSAAIILISYTIGYQLADSWLNRPDQKEVSVSSSLYTIHPLYCK